MSAMQTFLGTYIATVYLSSRAPNVCTVTYSFSRFTEGCCLDRSNDCVVARMPGGMMFWVDDSEASSSLNHDYSNDSSAIEVALLYQMRYG